MAKKVPQKNDFDMAEAEARHVRIVQWSSAGGSLLFAVIQKIRPENKPLEFVFSVIFLVLVGLNMYYKWRFSEIYRKAEETRRDGFIDNAFDIRLADIGSKGYYDTDDVNPGIIKLLANIHENSFFSEKVVMGMLQKTELPMLCGAVLVTIIAVTNFFGSHFTVAVIDMFFALDFLGEFAKLWRFKKDCEAVQKDCKAIWDEYSNIDSPKKTHVTTARAIRVLVQYETALAYAAIMFDSKIFNELNTETTKEWNKVKKRFLTNGY